MQRVGATNLICRVCVKGDESTGVPLLLLNPVSVRALVEMRGNCLNCNLLAEENCGADQTGKEEFGAKIGCVPCAGCNVCMLPVDDELGEGDPDDDVPS